MIQNSTTLAAEPSPAIRDALRTINFVTHRLEDEFNPFGWEERLELAAEVRHLRDDAPDSLTPTIRAVEFRLECEAFDFSDWEERLEAAQIMRAVSAGLRQEGGKGN
jgi:hypothetical protein